MKWWIMALIISAVWIGLCLGGAYLIFPSNTTPEQDAKLSETLGEVCGFGLVALWAIIAWKFGKLGPKKPKA